MFVHQRRHAGGDRFGRIIAPATSVVTVPKLLDQSGLLMPLARSTCFPVRKGLPVAMPVRVEENS